MFPRSHDAPSSNDDYWSPLEGEADLQQFTIANRTIIKSAMMEVELMSSPTAPYSTAKG